MTVRVILMADVAALGYGASSTMDALPILNAALTTTLTVLTIVYLAIRIGEWLWRTGKRLRGRKTRRG